MGDMQELLRQELRRRIGIVPAAFSTNGDGSGLLWDALGGYLHTPLPAALVDRLLAMLASETGHSYLAAVHACALHQAGTPGGEIFDLLTRHLPGGNPSATATPEAAGRESLPGGEAESAVMGCARTFFTGHDGDGRARGRLRELLGSRFQHLIGLLGYVRALHLWMEALGPLSVEQDEPLRMRLSALLAEAPALESVLARSRPAAGPRQASQRWLGRGLRTTLASWPFPVMVYAEDGEVLRINDAWEMATGYGLEETPTLDAWREKAQPEWPVPAPDEIDSLFAGDERLDEGEQEVQTSMGATIIWDFSSVPVGRLDDSRRVVMRMGTDVTERRRLMGELDQTNQTLAGMVDALTQANHRLDALIRSSPHPIVTIDGSHLVTAWNPAAEALFGWRASEVLQRPLPLVPAGMRHVFDGVVQGLTAGRAMPPMDVPCLHRDGSTVMVHMAIAAVRAEDGRMLDLMAIMTPA